MVARATRLADVGAISAIYNQGIEDHIATFETRLQTKRRNRYLGSMVAIQSQWSSAMRALIAFAATAMYRISGSRFARHSSAALLNPPELSLVLHV